MCLGSAGFLSLTADVWLATVSTTNDYYSTLQEAYDSREDGDTIQSIQSRAEVFTENFNINRNVSITLQGGFNCDYSVITGKTIINGDMIISNGVVTIQSGTLEVQ